MSGAPRPSCRLTISARSWSAPRRRPTATAWTYATCIPTCGPGSRTTTAPSLSFYNFPYAFGLLFGLGLYAVYQERGDAFLPEYDELLRSTGEGTAADLAARFGIDIRQRAFWEGSLQVIGQRIDRYAAL